LTEGFNLIWVVDQGSGGHGLLQVASGGEAAGDRANAAAQGGGSPARRRKRAGVLQSRRGRHHDDGKRMPITTVASRGGRDGSTRRTAGGRGGGGPARPSGRHEAHGREHTAPRRSLPRGEATQPLQSDRTAAEARVQHDDRLGLGAMAATGAEAVRVSVRGPQGCGGGFIGRWGAPWRVGPAREAGPRWDWRRRGGVRVGLGWRRGMTGGPHPSAAGNGRAREAGRLGRWRCWAGLQAVTRGRGKKTGGRGRTSQERAATQRLERRPGS
jgi:hypothetical protein